MKLRTFLIIAAVVALVYALGLLLMPAFMAITYGLGTSASEILLARYFGVELLVLGVITWLAKDFSAANARPIITGSLIGNIVGTYFALMGTLGGVMNSVGWSAVAVYLLLALGFAMSLVETSRVCVCVGGISPPCGARRLRLARCGEADVVLTVRLASRLTVSKHGGVV